MAKKKATHGACKRTQLVWSASAGKKVKRCKSFAKSGSKRKAS